MQRLIAYVADYEKPIIGSYWENFERLKIMGGQFTHDGFVALTVAEMGHNGDMVLGTSVIMLPIGDLPRNLEEAMCDRENEMYLRQGRNLYREMVGAYEPEG